MLGEASVAVLALVLGAVSAEVSAAVSGEGSAAMLA